MGKDAHSVADHTQTNWNGIVGRIELRATASIWIKDLQVYPKLSTKTVQVRATLGNATGRDLRGSVRFAVRERSTATSHASAPIASTRWEGELRDRDTVVTVELPLGNDVKLWDEFSPALYELTASLSSEQAATARHEKTVCFGMREFGTQGTQFTINGRPTFLRGTLECCIFPLTGYPPTDMAHWTRIFRVAKAHGLNHVRFHPGARPKRPLTRPIARASICTWKRPSGPCWAAIRRSTRSSTPKPTGSSRPMATTRRSACSVWGTSRAGKIATSSSRRSSTPGKPKTRASTRARRAGRNWPPTSITC